MSKKQPEKEPACRYVAMKKLPKPLTPETIMAEMVWPSRSGEFQQMFYHLFKRNPQMIPHREVSKTLPWKQAGDGDGLQSEVNHLSHESNPRYRQGNYSSSDYPLLATTCPKLGVNVL